MRVVFTDLDGTLLDHDTYSWDAARPALELLKKLAIPLVFVTSKTRAEVESWRRVMGNRHPFIVENGGGAFIPAGYFSHPIEQSTARDGYVVLEWGDNYADLIASLEAASRASGCAVRGFHQMTVDEVAERCGLSSDDAARAKQREYDEPFLVLDAGRADALEAAVRAQGKQLTRGGRFWHILGGSDKARAVQELTAHFEVSTGPVTSIGLGDSLNDIGFLSVVETPVLIRSPQLEAMQRGVPRGIVTHHPGPAGWNETLQRILA
jgi:mannosyl-3-phosphoglycerate phosphatase